jgi:YD repeat-containing protein
VWQGEYSANYSYYPTSALISQIDYKWVNTNKLTSVRVYDNFNRLSRVTNTPSADTAVNFAYAYNSASERTGLTNTDSSRWVFS